MNVQSRIDGWSVKTIGEIAHVGRGASPRPIASDKWFDAGSEVRWVRIADLNRSNGRVLKKTTQALSADGISRSRYLEPGSLILSIAATVGLPIITGIPTCIHDGFVSLTSLSADQRFLYYALKFSQERLKEAGQSGSQTNVNTEIVKGFKILVPKSRKEQERIAQVLWETDDYIDEITSLISKKRDIKQGVMQQLLTGRTRLPGFESPWSTKELGEVLTVKHGKDQKLVSTSNSEIPILATGGQIGWATRPIYSSPSVLIGRKGTIDKPQFQDKPFWTIDTLFYTELSSSVDPKFIFYVFQTIDWLSLNEASGVPSLNSKKIEQQSVSVPPIREQIAIREALDLLTREILLLEQKLAKMKDIKQGMMQQLLTGRVRLPLDKEVEA